MIFKRPIYNPDVKLLKDSVILFTINGCQYCRKYSTWIQRMNQKLPINKRVEIIDCTYYHDYKINTDPRIQVFFKHYNGTYPSLFIKGELIAGANSEEELIARVVPYFIDEFIVAENLTTNVNGEEIPMMFNKTCSYIKEGSRKGEIKCQ